jgi:hypothetical protein
MNDIMLDIETLGTSPGYIVTSFCAVNFQLETDFVNLDYFYQSISIKSSLKYGLKIDPETMKWWMRQDEETINKFLALDHSGDDLKRILEEFTVWLINFPNPTLWGNGNRFDCGILEGAFKAVGYSAPWTTKNERDMRTYIMHNEHVYEPSSNRGTTHDPYEDCLYQIKVLQKVYKLKHQQ